MHSKQAPVRAGVETGLHEYDHETKLSSHSGESNGFGFVVRADLFNPEWHFLSCFWPYHFGSVIAGEFRLSAGYVLQRPRPGNPVTGESRTKPSAVMGQNLPRPQRRHKAGMKADDLAPKHRGWDFLMVDPKQGKPLASTKTQSKMLSTVQAAKKLKEALCRYQRMKNMKQEVAETGRRTQRVATVTRQQRMDEVACRFKSCPPDLSGLATELRREGDNRLAEAAMKWRHRKAKLIIAGTLFSLARALENWELAVGKVDL